MNKPLRYHLLNQEAVSYWLCSKFTLLRETQKSCLWNKSFHRSTDIKNDKMTRVKIQNKLAKHGILVSSSEFLLVFA